MELGIEEVIEFKVWDLIWVSDLDFESALHTYVDNRKFKFYYTGWKDRQWNYIVETVQIFPHDYEKVIFEEYKHISKPLFKN